MDISTISKIKKVTHKQISELEQQLELCKKATQTVELDQTLAGRVSRIDAIQQQKMAQSSFARDNKRLLKLNGVLQRLSDEKQSKKQEYGRCEECDQEIAIARLMVKPESTNCIACQQLLESEKSFL